MSDCPSLCSQPNHPQAYQDTKLLQALVHCIITKNHVNVIYTLNATLFGVAIIVHTG